MGWGCWGEVLNSLMMNTLQHNNRGKKQILEAVHPPPPQKKKSLHLHFPGLPEAPQGAHAATEVGWVRTHTQGGNGVRIEAQGAARASNKQGSLQALKQKAGVCKNVDAHACMASLWFSQFPLHEGHPNVLWPCVYMSSASLTVELSMIQWYVLSLNEEKKTNSNPLLKSAITTIENIQNTSTKDSTWPRA